jgi:hypothetical protein
MANYCLNLPLKTTGDELLYWNFPSVHTDHEVQL